MKEENTVFAIFKYSMYKKINKILIPEDGMVLSIQLQGETVVMWVLIDTSKSIEEQKEFWIINTGQRFKQIDGKELLSYLGTVQFSNGIVQHVFEKLLFDTEEEI